MASPQASDGALIPSLQERSDNASNFQANGGSPSTLPSIPTELLLNIATYLAKQDLCNLMRASRKLTAIAQDRLYQKPTIHVSRYLQGRSRIALLARTMLGRPDLAQKVRSLLLWPSTDLVIVESAEYLPRNFGVITEVKRETQYAGDILGCVTKATSLTLRVEVGLDCIEDLDFPFADHSMTEFLFDQQFQYHSDGQQADLALVPGLKDLTRISLGGTFVPWAWCELPHLKSLHISGRSAQICPPEGAQALQIETLHLDWGASLLCPSCPLDDSIGRLLEGLPMLKYLTVTLCELDLEDFVATDVDTDDLIVGHLTSSKYGEFDKLIHSLLPVASTIKHLAIAECEAFCHDHAKDASFLRFTLPASSLVHFESLERLEIPYEALIGNEHRKATEVLPTSLIQLEIHAPSVKGIIPFFMDIAQAKDHFSNLLRVILITYESRGNTLAEFRYRHPRVIPQVLEDTHTPVCISNAEMDPYAKNGKTRITIRLFGRSWSSWRDRRRSAHRPAQRRGL